MCVYVCGMSPYVYALLFPFELKACGPLVQCLLLSFIWGDLRKDLSQDLPPRMRACSVTKSGPTLLKPHGL